MTFHFTKTQLALAAVAAVGSIGMAAAPAIATAAGKTPGKYVAGDFHNHTTCSDGSISMQKLVQKSTSKTPDAPWGLDWFVQAGHGGTGNRNCTLAEDASLATPAYPLVYTSGGVLQGPNTTWQNTNPPVQVKGNVSGTAPNQNMWRWQAVQEIQYPLIEYLAAQQNKPMFLGIESVVAGHEHSSMAIVTGQIPKSLDSTTLPATGPYTALGNANALAQWAYCFDRGVSDTSRGNTTATSGVGNNWDCSVPGSLNAADPTWNAAAAKLVPSGSTQGTTGHNKTVEAIKWMKAFHPNTSYYVPAHLERAGPFVPSSNNGFNIEHLRNMNNAGPGIAFGFESQPGHGGSENRGEYAPRRNTVGTNRLDSVGGTTYGGTGIYAAYVGGVWDALLGEGRNWFFFASSDWHSRGAFGIEDRRTDNDFFPGEYQRNYTMVRNGADKLRPDTIVNGLRSGNGFATSGQLIDRLAFVACVSYPGIGARTQAQVEALAVTAAANNTDIDVAGCATMGEKLTVNKGGNVIVAIVARDPSGSNYSPYTFPNPSLKQIGITQPLDKPVLDHIDVIGGLVTGLKSPTASDYAGAWPNNWVFNPDPATLPAAVKNPSTGIKKVFNASNWTSAGSDLLKMSYVIPAVQASQYVRLRGTNLPASTPFETDANGNPLRDLETNSSAVNASTTTGTDGFPANFFLKIPCTTVGTTQFDGCPSHLPTVNGQKMVAVDIAAWSDLWFYSNPIFIQVNGSTSASMALTAKSVVR